MGYGDVLMAAGQAQTVFDQQPSAGPVTICDGSGRPRWHFLWSGNPAVRVPSPGDPPYRAPFILSGNGCLPYLQYPYSIHTGWRFSTTWRARDHRGRLYLTADELARGQAVRKDIGPFILVEPPSTRRAPNRRGPLDHWLSLTGKFAPNFPYRFAQLWHGHAAELPTTVKLIHADFRDACAILSAAAALVTVEGGLAHAAAALHVPTVVLWGGCVSADVLGYPEQVNLVDPDPRTPCGSLAVCDHCTQAWRRYDTADIARALTAVLERTI